MTSNPNKKPKVIVTRKLPDPIETRLLREAREIGCTTIDGAAMFVNQASAQFTRWTNQPAPTDIMRKVVIERLQASQ